MNGHMMQLYKINYHAPMVIVLDKCFLQKSDRTFIGKISVCINDEIKVTQFIYNG